MNEVTYKFSRVPGFLQRCFHWNGRGYHYSGPAPDEVLSPDGWMSEDPWIALASILESAKRADYGHISRLRPWVLKEDSAPTLVSACLALTADAGLHEDLEFLAD